jgi:NadR type nicotinamide-nucleotide adenylyltransferase
MSRALVIGKFVPPHAGHAALVEHARTLADAVDVVVCDLPGQRPDAASRVRWMAAIHPEARVRAVDDVCTHGPGPCAPECSPRWAAHLRALGLGPWDVVVTSELYGEPFAAALGARAACFDPDRGRVAVSGTAVRGDLRGHWLRLHPVVRAGLVRRVVIVGAESTGTTTLATALADRLAAPWVPEYGRTFTLERAAAEGGVEAIEWRPEHFAHIAREQVAHEDAAIRAVVDAPPVWPNQDGPWVVCDTDALATSIWHERYLGTPCAAALALVRPPALYVLTSPDGVAFEQDGIRDGEHLRGWMTARFREVLASQAAPWILVTGAPAERCEAALAALRSLPPLFVAAPDRNTKEFS